jgi:hypothetical protein
MSYEEEDTCHMRRRIHVVLTSSAIHTKSTAQTQSPHGGDVDDGYSR